MYIQKNEEFSGIQELTFDEVGEVNGALFPIIIAGYVITAKGAAIATVGLAAVGAFGVGVYNGYQSTVN